jgi:uncharacterized protein YndB with AHSA1/START domain
MRATETKDARLGTVDRSGDEFRLAFVRDYAHSTPRVWRWLTDPDRTRTWWADSVIDLRVGGAFSLRWLNGADGKPLDWWPGEIIELEPERVLAHTNVTHGVLRWELHPTPAGTRLLLTNTISPSEDRLVTMSLGGWHLHLDHLRDSLEGRVIDWTRWYPTFGDKWDDVHTQYQRVTGLP